MITVRGEKRDHHDKKQQLWVFNCPKIIMNQLSHSLIGGDLDNFFRKNMLLHSNKELPYVVSNF